MLITFRSSASNDVLMFESAAKDILRCIGKGPDEATGIITPAQLPDAINSIKVAIAADRTTPAPPTDPMREDEVSATDEPVSFAQRARPMLELMERALAEDAPVVWGV